MDPPPNTSTSAGGQRKMDYGRIFDEGVNAARNTTTAVCPYSGDSGMARAWLAGYAFEQDTAREHWQQKGRQAHAQGVAAHDCPHPHDPICASAWLDGWQAAQDEAEAAALPKKGRTVDGTPTWVGLLPALLHVIENGPDSARDAAAAELRRLAATVDELNASADRQRRK
jgi:ribosome modulation factor